MTMVRRQRWIDHLTKIYGDDRIAETTASRMEARFKAFESCAQRSAKLTEKDAMLITYGDTIGSPGRKGLAVLRQFLKKHVGDAVSSIHILPMFPYTSDDGFSVVDYKQINPDLGTWADIALLAEDYGLMFDAVVNHISKSSQWFRAYLDCRPPYTDYFITSDPEADYSAVTRPRALPLLTEFDTAQGKKHVWTTFSEDQIDLNYRCADVLIDMLDVLLTYAKNGARFIRLDAIGFLWKEAGTSCMHLPQTHEVIKLMRTVLEDYAPGTMLITETNVPHRDNISYFGNGSDEAHLVYQFPLPPLVMFSLLKGDAARLTEWAKRLDAPLPGTTYFNFLSSHDGIGFRPTEGILTEDERGFLVESTLANGGAVSYKDNGDGTKSPYELNINYQDALADPEAGDDVRIARFIAAETILLSMQGMPGIYIHSLLGSRNDCEGMKASGIARRINREKLEYDTLERELEGNSSRRIIFDELIRRLRIRGGHPAFSPDAAQEILETDRRVFAVRRTASCGETVTALINVSGDPVALEDDDFAGYDLLRGEMTDAAALEAYGCMWIAKAREKRSVD